jgi:uncharacterized protein (TIGR00251 family)
MHDWFRIDAEGSVTLHVHAQPGARRSSVAGLHGAAVKIRVAAPAIDDRANEALAAFLAERFGVARRDVRLVSGGRSREKRFAIRGSRLAPDLALGLAEES